MHHRNSHIDRYDTYIIITDRMPRASTCISAIKSQPVWPICSLSRSRQRKAHSTSGEVRSQPAEAKSAVFRDSSTHDHPCSIEHIGRGTQAAISSADEPQTTPGSAASLYRLPTAGGRCALLLNEHARFFSCATARRTGAAWASAWCGWATHSARQCGFK